MAPMTLIGFKMTRTGCPVNLLMVCKERETRLGFFFVTKQNLCFFDQTEIISFGNGHNLTPFITIFRWNLKD